MNPLIMFKRFSGDKQQRVVYLSQIKPAGFEESGIGLNAISIKTDAYQWIQNVLYGGYIDLHWDLAVSLSDTLFLESNTNIIVSEGKGAVLRNGVNKPMIQNRNYRFFDNSTIIDKNISINGGIFNGNSSGQPIQGTPQFGFNTIFTWIGVNGLVLKNLKMFTPRVYCQMAFNVVGGHISDFVIDVGDNPSINMDGVHWDGWCKGCSVKRGKIRSYDDGIAMNADDLWHRSDSPAIGFYPYEANGPISDIEIEDIEFNNSLFGIRILSGQSKIKNISIKNISGTTYNYSILIDNYWQQPNNLDKPGKGNVEDVVIDNVTTIVPTKDVGFVVNKAKLSLSCSIKNMKATNITGTGTSNPMVSKLNSSGSYTYVYENVTVNGSPI